jgi:hypothetical protein
VFHHLLSKIITPTHPTPILVDPKGQSALNATNLVTLKFTAKNTSVGTAGGKHQVIVPATVMQVLGRTVPLMMQAGMMGITMKLQITISTLKARSPKGINRG